MCCLFLSTCGNPEDPERIGRNATNISKQFIFPTKMGTLPEPVGWAALIDHTPACRRGIRHDGLEDLLISADVTPVYKHCEQPWPIAHYWRGMKVYADRLGGQCNKPCRRTESEVIIMPVDEEIATQASISCANSIGFTLRSSAATTRSRRNPSVHSLETLA